MAGFGSKLAIGRRGFLGGLVAAPAAAPLLKRAIEQNAMMEQGNVGVIAGTSSLSRPVQAYNEAQTASHIEPFFVRARRVLANDVIRQEIEDLCWLDHRSVHAIDHDLAACQSFSLAAKITFQRQRNVQHQFENLITERESPWDKLRQAVDRLDRPLAALADITEQRCKPYPK